mgnify:CR=1 FL=1
MTGGAVHDAYVGCLAINNTTTYHTDDGLLQQGSNESKESNQGSVIVMYVAALMLISAVTRSSLTSLLPSSHKNQNKSDACHADCHAARPTVYPSVRCLIMSILMPFMCLIQLTIHFCECTLTLIATSRCLRLRTGTVSLKLFILFIVFCESANACRSMGSQGTQGGFTDFTTGGCSGKSVALTSVLLVSLPNGCQAVDQWAIALPAIASGIATLSDGPIAAVQWALFNRAPNIVATLESYRWTPSQSRTQEASPDTSDLRDDRKESDSSAVDDTPDDYQSRKSELNQLPAFDFTPPSQWVTAVWCCFLSWLLSQLRCRRRSRSFDDPAAAPVVNNINFSRGFWSRTSKNPDTTAAVQGAAGNTVGTDMAALAEKLKPLKLAAIANGCITSLLSTSSRPPWQNCNKMPLPRIPSLLLMTFRLYPHHILKLLTVTEGVPQLKPLNRNFWVPRSVTCMLTFRPLPSVSGRCLLLLSLALDVTLHVGIPVASMKKQNEPYQA